MKPESEIQAEIDALSELIEQHSGESHFESKCRDWQTRKAALEWVLENE